MEELKKAALDTIEENKELIASVADQIWEYAELSLQEVRSAALYCKMLKELGFAVEEGVCSISTAFVASYGSGRPIIGILAEYDALSGLSQLGGSIKKQELTPGGTGHGCGHNLLGAGALAAALGIKHYLQQMGAPGTVVLYGCPGEEGGAAKAFMAREKLWYGLDAALTWHPDDCNEAATGSSNACIQVQYIFHGVAAHAAGNPERGRSALDAVTLMNVGVQFLREHMEPQARIHYAVTDGGGCSPNVVQSKASVLYMVRSPQVKKAVELQKRVDDIAAGAALMTGTTCERKFIDGVAETIPNHVLEALLYQNFAEVGVPQHTPEEMAFATELATTYDAGRHIPGSGSENAAYAAQVKTLLPGFSGSAVLDADGLNAAADLLQMGKMLHPQGELILTPHPGEMARLTGHSAAEINADREGMALRYAKAWNAVVVLKGAHTVIAGPDGRCAVNPTGNPGLSRGGSGDVLAGMTRALLACGLPAFEAAACAVYLHGAAADRAAALHGETGMLPHDLLDALGTLFAENGR